MLKSKNSFLLAILILLGLVASCGPTPTPEQIVVVETVIVEKEGEPVTVIETVEVEKIVEVEVERIVEVTAEAIALPYEGVEATIVTRTGPEIAEPLQRRASEFQELTGATINIVTVPFADLYQTILTDLTGDADSFDGFVFVSQWMDDYIRSGYLEDITERVNADEALAWQDVAPFFREFSAAYDGRVYTVPLAGDFQMVYYRTDVLEELGVDPPKTWDDYLEIAAVANGLDMNDDDQPDYGSCVGRSRGQQSYPYIISIAGAFLQSQGTAQGALFDTETFEPLVDNDGFKRALEVYKESMQYGPPDPLSLDIDNTRELMITGRCALTLDSGDIGALMVYSDQAVAQEKIGAVILPGSTEVVDRESGELVPCDENICPYATDDINHAPFAAFGGWSGGVNAAADDAVKAVVYDFFSYVSQPEQSNEDVTLNNSGFNPYRVSQFLNRQPWVEAGMRPDTAAVYLSAIEDSLSNPNMALDLRIPQNQRYQGEALDRILSQYLADEFTTDEAAAEIYTQWEKITEELDRDEQLEAYRASIGAN